MNNRTSLALLVVLTVAGTLAMSTVYAERDLPQACVGCSMEDARDIANEMLLRDLPVSVWTDRTDYGHNDMIKVSGMVASVSESDLTIVVTSPLNNIVTVAQIKVAKDGSFQKTLNTGGAFWKYDGTYTIKVNYGSAEKSNKVKVGLDGGIKSTQSYSTPDPDVKCRGNDLSANGQCIPYSISGGTVISATLNNNDNSIIININAKDDGILMINPSKTVQDGIFMVLVDGEEWDDVEIVNNKVTVMFPAGAEQIEVIGTFVIPEFGTIAAMILAVAIISIIAISAKSRLSIIPRY